MAEVRLREAAEADLDLVLSFSVTGFGREVASAYLDSFDDAFALLARHPEVGAVLRPGKIEIHSYPCRSHRIFYSIEGDVVWIIRILHKSRNHDRIMREWLKR